MEGALPLMTRKFAVCVWLLAEAIAVYDLKIYYGKLALYSCIFCHIVSNLHWIIGMM